MLHEQGIPIPNPPPVAEQPDAFDNAKHELITCAGLKPRCNSSPNDLILTLNLIHIRHQHETWYSATFVTDSSGTQIDLIKQFLKPSGTDILAKAKSTWIKIISSPTNTCMEQRHMQGFWSISYHPKYSMDGPLLLHTKCHHIH
jgi:hypothetical protein